MFYGYTLETSGTLDGGRKVWALARTGLAGAADDSGTSATTCSPGSAVSAMRRPWRSSG